MLSPLIQRDLTKRCRAEIRTACQSLPQRDGERGVTMALVAVSMVAIISMAALAIDLGTLYEAKTEAQRAADAGALAAARVISVSGVTTDPNNAGGSWVPICGSATSAATLAAINVAQQNLIGGAAASTVNVSYGTSGGVVPGAMDCTVAGPSFGINPVVQVQVKQATLPTFFARVFSMVGGASSNSGVSATATAEAFNSSNSGSYAVEPRCVKPWMIPNYNPVRSANTCTTGCVKFIDVATGGNILNAGTFPPNVIGESFWLVPACSQPLAPCGATVTPTANTGTSPGIKPGSSNLQYFPGEAPPASVAVPAATSGACAASTTNYAQAIAGCDKTTQYQCGVAQENVIDFTTEHPTNADTTNGGRCLIHEGIDPGLNDALAEDGQDTLAPFPTQPPNYPFQIQAGTDNPLTNTGLVSGSFISSSTSIASLPIFDLVGVSSISSTATTTVSIVGFLQVFINFVDDNGNVNVTVMNVAGCGGVNPTPVFGSSPVPIRLITQP
jgi:Flp pilus assembly protein TadG